MKKLSDPVCAENTHVCKKDEAVCQSYRFGSDIDKRFAIAKLYQKIHFAILSIEGNIVFSEGQITT